MTNFSFTNQKKFILKIKIEMFKRIIKWQIFFRRSATIFSSQIQLLLLLLLLLLFLLLLLLFVCLFVCSLVVVVGLVVVIVAAVVAVDFLKCICTRLSNVFSHLRNNLCLCIKHRLTEPKDNN